MKSSLEKRPSLERHASSDGPPAVDAGSDAPDNSSISVTYTQGEMAGQKAFNDQLTPSLNKTAAALIQAVFTVNSFLFTGLDTAMAGLEAQAWNDFAKTSDHLMRQATLVKDTAELSFTLVGTVANAGGVSGALSVGKAAYAIIDGTKGVIAVSKAGAELIMGKDVNFPDGSKASLIATTVSTVSDIIAIGGLGDIFDPSAGKLDVLNGIATVSSKVIDGFVNQTITFGPLKVDIKDGLSAGSSIDVGYINGLPGGPANPPSTLPGTYKINGGTKVVTTMPRDIISAITKFLPTAETVNAVLIALITPESPDAGADASSKDAGTDPTSKDAGPKPTDAARPATGRKYFTWALGVTTTYSFTGPKKPVAGDTETSHVTYDTSNIPVSWNENTFTFEEKGDPYLHVLTGTLSDDNSQRLELKETNVSSGKSGASDSKLVLANIPLGALPNGCWGVNIQTGDVSKYVTEHSSVYTSLSLSTGEMNFQGELLSSQDKADKLQIKFSDLSRDYF